MTKTNAMRQLDAAKIKYTPCVYEVDENNLAGTHIADSIGEVLLKKRQARNLGGEKEKPN